MEEYVEYLSHSPGDTARIAAEVTSRLKAGDIILYEGDMGAGKTTFTKGIAAALGITDPVTSPTFALVNEYPEGRIPLFHFDLYRIDSYDDCTPSESWITSTAAELSRRSGARILRGLSRSFPGIPHGRY